MPDEITSPPPQPEERRIVKRLDVKSHLRHPFSRWLAAVLEYPMRLTFTYRKLNRVYEKVLFESDRDSLFQACLDDLEVRYSLACDDLKRIPSKGPLVVVANHPFGGLEGIVLGDIFAQVRPDVKFLGNHLLEYLSDICGWVIPANRSGPAAPGQAASPAARQAVDWVRAGGALVTFPADDVSQLRLRKGAIADPEWNPFVGSVIRQSQAAVLPVFFPGANSLLFQIAGLIHPVLRNALLPHEQVNKRSKVIEVFIGRPLPWAKLESFATDRDTIRYLQVSTEFLCHRGAGRRVRIPKFGRAKIAAAPQEEIIPPEPPPLLIRDMEALPPEATLAEKGDYAVCLADAGAIPHILREIGRLREITFREVQEGTGKSMDLDAFDPYYLHLFLWNKSRRELAGAYRFGLLDRILVDHGPEGVYTSTLFKFKPGFLERLGCALELGRSFIRSEYQKEYNCLSMLWRGIGAFIARNPQYKILFGPVSISDDYHAVSRSLIVQFLRQKKFDAGLSRFVSARAPYRAGKVRPMDPGLLRSCVRDIDDVSLLISEIEKDG
ncbi:MAG: lysophospholipid acyltransferase family protein, partial [Lentisphaerae bacterium]|nr:lysophospholipid acyltransferase family protein [Lentisphaerota bacterium]